MAKAKPRLSPSLHPTRVTQVNAFLRQNGVENVELRRYIYYFEFFGPPTYGWMTSSVRTDRLNSITLGEWLEKYRELERQNRSDPLGAKAAKKAQRETPNGGARSAASPKRLARSTVRRRGARRPR
jgi:hypothetical protein